MSPPPSEALAVEPALASEVGLAPGIELIAELPEPRRGWLSA